MMAAMAAAAPAAAGQQPQQQQPPPQRPAAAAADQLPTSFAAGPAQQQQCRRRQRRGGTKRRQDEWSPPRGARDAGGHRPEARAAQAARQAAPSASPGLSPTASGLAAAAPISSAEATWSVGDAVEVLWHGKPYDGTVTRLDTAGERTLVAYDPPFDRYRPEWRCVPARPALRIPLLAVTVGC